MGVLSYAVLPERVYSGYMEPATAVFGGGCFWCTEAVFRMLRGVISVESGYAGGAKDNPTYAQVCAGSTGHAEVIRVTFDPKQITYEDLLTVFFGSHDPTTPDRQGADVGEQYRSIILYADHAQRDAANAMIANVQASLTDGSRVVTEVVPLERFYPAEAHHQNYFTQNTTAPYCELVIEPKIQKIRERFAQLVHAGEVPGAAN